MRYLALSESAVARLVQLTILEWMRALPRTSPIWQRRNFKTDEAAREAAAIAASHRRTLERIAFDLSGVELPDVNPSACEAERCFPCAGKNEWIVAHMWVAQSWETMADQIRRDLTEPMMMAGIDLEGIDKPHFTDEEMERRRDHDRRMDEAAAFVKKHTRNGKRPLTEAQEAERRALFTAAGPGSVK